jgi:hypothetical protein
MRIGYGSFLTCIAVSNDKFVERYVTDIAAYLFSAAQDYRGVRFLDGSKIGNIDLHLLEQWLRFERVCASGVAGQANKQRKYKAQAEFFHKPNSPAK